jgi:hypothetical protein
MATLVVCLDGTTQTKTQQHPTNIAGLFDALGGSPTDAGNGSFETTVGAQGDPVLRLLGNAFGDCLAEHRRAFDMPWRAGSG